MATLTDLKMAKHSDESAQLFGDALRLSERLSSDLIPVRHGAALTTQQPRVLRTENRSDSKMDAQLAIQTDSSMATATDSSTVRRSGQRDLGLDVGAGPPVSG